MRQPRCVLHGECSRAAGHRRMLATGGWFWILLLWYSNRLNDARFLGLLCLFLG